MIHINIFIHFLCFAFGIGLITYCYQQYKMQPDEVRKGILICELVFVLMFFLDTVLVYIRNILHNSNLELLFNGINYLLFFFVVRYAVVIIQNLWKRKTCYEINRLDKILVGANAIVLVFYILSIWISYLQTIPLLCILYLLQGSLILVNYIKRRTMQEQISSPQQGSSIEMHLEEPKNIEERMDEIENLTTREKEIITYIYKGLSNKEIAEDLFISPNTVKNHIYNIYKKLEIKNKVELIKLIDRGM